MGSFFDFLKTKPALKVTLPFIVGLILSYQFEIEPAVILITLLVITVVSLIVMRFAPKAVNLLLILALIAAGILRYSVSNHVMPSNHILHFLDNPEKISMTGKICGYPQQKKHAIVCEFEVDTLVINKQRFATHGKTLLNIKEVDYSPRYGDRLRIFAKLKAPSGERNPGEFNYQKFLATQNIYGLIHVLKNEDITLLNRTSAKTISSLFCAIKTSLNNKINSLYGIQSRALIKGLILGERGEISADLREAFAKCGVIHALAISGLHVGYILLIFFAIFGLLRVPHRTKILLVLIGIIFYNLLIGFRPPIFRASLMAGIFLFGRLFQKPVDIFNIISVAALLILLVNPAELFQASFQLSFGAILSIVLIYQKLKIFFDRNSFFNKLTRWKYGEAVAGLFLVSLAAQLGTLPIVAYYFNRVPIISLIANLIVIPVIGIILAYGFASLVFAYISFPIGQLFALTNSLIMKYLIILINFASGLRFSSFQVYSIGLAAIAFYYFALWLILNFDKKLHRKIAVFSLLLCCNFFIWKSVFADNNWLTVTFLDVGQGDSAFIEFPNGDNLLIDAGPNFAGFDAGKYFVHPYLQRKNIKKINKVILTHADNDHIGGMPHLFRNISIGKLFDTGLYHRSHICSTYNFLIDSLNLDYSTVNRSFALEVNDNLGAYILHPNKSFLKLFPRDVNNNSVVLKIVYGNTSFLFTGDIEKEAESVLSNYGDLLKSDILKVAHHGSNTSTTQQMLELIRPKIAVISLGKNNRFNFPKEAILERLREFDIDVIRTDLNGAVIFRSNGIKIERIR